MNVKVGEQLKHSLILALGLPQPLLVLVIHPAQLVGSEEQSPGHSDGREYFVLLHLIPYHLNLLLVVFAWELPS